jgi:hypothetical protein
MPNAWDPQVYRHRAAAWRDRAILCKDERQRNACIVLAEGYDRLADLLDTSAEHFREPGGTPDAAPL